MLIQVVGYLIIQISNKSVQLRRERVINKNYKIHSLLCDKNNKSIHIYPTNFRVHNVSKDSIQSAMNEYMYTSLFA